MNDTAKPTKKVVAPHLRAATAEQFTSANLEVIMGLIREALTDRQQFACMFEDGSYTLSIMRPPMVIPACDVPVPEDQVPA